MLPERGEGCRCKGKTPKTFMCVCVSLLCAESGVSGVLSSDNDLPNPISGNSGEALHLQLSPSGSDTAGKVIG